MNIGWTAFLASCILVFATGTASAEYPERPVKIVVPYAAGGSSDMIARLLGEELGKQLQQPFVVDNRPGAGSLIGTQFVADSPADGYTLLLADTPFTTVPALYGAKVRYDNEKGFAPVALVGASPVYLFVHAAIPSRNLDELVRASQGGGVSIGSGGTGSLTHLMAEMLNVNTGARMVHVPYKGAAAAMADLASGQIQAQFAALASASGVFGTGRIRPIAVTGTARAKEMAQVPTLAEGGAQGFDLEVWWALLAPAGVSNDVQARLESALQRVLALPNVRSKLQAAGVNVPSDLSPEAVRTLIRKDNARWRSVVDKARIKLE